jgi:hypothetical protein
MICPTASARSGSSYFDTGRIKELHPFAVNEDRWLSPSKHHAADAGINDELGACARREGRFGARLEACVDRGGSKLALINGQFVMAASLTEIWTERHHGHEADVVRREAVGPRE